MDLHKLICSCSYCEMNDSVEKSIELAKKFKVPVELTVYKNSLRNKITVFIKARSRRDDVLKYVEKQLV